MKIALIGYGKMGHAIEAIASENNHTIVLAINSSNQQELTKTNLAKADVAIEFTNPQSAIENILLCFNTGVPVICGSTGWLEHWDKITEACKEKNGSLVYASNFSVGVNIFFELNKKLASLMQGQPGYNVSIEEIHHTAKKDAPSGTAITLAEQIISLSPVKKKWVNNKTDFLGELSIVSKRIDPAPGTHHVKYSSSIDDIEIIHTAHNRQGFAAGAVLAAEFIKDKKGIFSMADVLNF
ncbi:MAG: 4-hydroxy-tetrahydrodipicolinate reductase [Ferruginibacter sp.]